MFFSRYLNRRVFLFSILPASESFGYTMSDLKYAWNSGHNSVQMSPDVSLPQFNILGHRQRLIEVTLLSLQLGTNLCKF